MNTMDVYFIYREIYDNAVGSGKDLSQSIVITKDTGDIIIGNKNYSEHLIFFGDENSDGINEKPANPIKNKLYIDRKTGEGYTHDGDKWIQVIYGTKSAYEIALKYGFEGTEEEWLESLKVPVSQNMGDNAEITMSQAAITENINKMITLPFGGSKEWLVANGDTTKLYQINGYIWGYIESTGWIKGNIQYTIVNDISEMTGDGNLNYLLNNGQEGIVYQFIPATGDVDVVQYTEIPDAEQVTDGDIITIIATDDNTVNDIAELDDLDTSKDYILEDTGDIYQYKSVDLGEVREQIFDPDNFVNARLSSSSGLAESTTERCFICPLDVSRIPEGEVGYVEFVGIYNHKSGNTPVVSKIAYMASETPVIGDDPIDDMYTETANAYGPGTGYIEATDTGFIITIGYHSGVAIEGIENTKSFIVNITDSTVDASNVKVYFYFNGGVQDIWTTTGLTTGKKYKCVNDNSSITWTELGDYIEPTASRWEETEERYNIISSTSVDGVNGDIAVFLDDGYKYTYINGSDWMEIDIYNDKRFAVDGELSANSTNPVKNKVITEKILELISNISKNSSDIKNINDSLSMLTSNGNQLTIPDAWVDAVNTCIDTIKTYQVGRNCIAFPFFSDNHNRVGVAGTLISYIMEKCNIPFCFFCGDSITSGKCLVYDTEAEMLEQDAEFDSMMKYIPEGRICRVVGNHDGYLLPLSTTDSSISDCITVRYTRDQIYDLFMREESIAQNKEFGGDGTYCYIDEKSSKVRFIIMNTNGGSIGADQIEWLTNTALVLPNSSWAVAFFGHAPITNNYHSGISNAGEVQEIIEDFIDNGGEVIGWFAGHIHRDRIFSGGYGKVTYKGTSYAKFEENQNVGTKEDGSTYTYSLSTDPIKDPHYPLKFKTITITSDNTSIAYDTDMVTKIDGSDTSHAIDFVVVNRSTRDVNIVRLGNHNTELGLVRSYNYSV